MRNPSRTRRQLLRLGGLATVAALAGCTDTDTTGGQTTDDEDDEEEATTTEDGGVTVLDDVEDGDISEYFDYRGDAYTVSRERSYDGDYAIRGEGGGNAFLADDGDLGTVEQGMRFGMRAYLASPDAEVGILFGVQEEGERNWYNAEYKAPQNRLSVFRDNETRSTVDVANQADVELPGGEWLRFEVVWDDGSLGGSAGDITFTVRDDTGTTLAEISGNNEFYTEGGIGYNNEDDVAYYDRYEILESA